MEQMDTRTEVTDAELAERARDGDGEAFTALYDRYVGKIYDFVRSRLHNQEDAEDVTSQTFLKAVEGIEDLKDPGAVVGWLYGIARNTMLDLRKKQRRETSMPEYYEPTEPAFAEATPGAPTPEERSQAADLQGLLHEATATLNERDRAVFDMTVRHGLGSAEIAKALDVKKSHAYVLVNRLKGSVETALSAVVLSRAGRRECSELEGILGRYGDERSPRMRKAVTKHLKKCETCETTRSKYASLESLMQGVAHAAPRPEFVSSLRSHLRTTFDAIGPQAPPSTSAISAARHAVVASSVVGAIVLGSVLGAAPPVNRGETPPPAAPAAALTSPSPTPEPTSEPTPEPTPGPTREPRKPTEASDEEPPEPTDSVEVVINNSSEGEESTTESESGGETDCPPGYDQDGNECYPTPEPTATPCPREQSSQGIVPQPEEGVSTADFDDPC